MKSPKLYRGDTGLALTLAGESEPRSPHLENVVLQDLRHLTAFQEEYGASVRAGLLLHAGDTLEWLTPRALAAPWWRVM